MIEVYPETNTSNKIGIPRNIVFKSIRTSDVNNSITIRKSNPGSVMQIPESQIKNLPDGRYTVRYTVIDSVGNEGVPVFSNFIKDTVNPRITFTKSGNSTFEIMVNINLNEAPISDLLQNQITVSHATISNFKKINPTNYQITLIPDCFGSIGLTIAAKTLVDLRNNFNIEQNFTSQTNGVGLPAGFESTLNLSGTLTQSINRKAKKINTNENVGINKNHNYSATQSIELKPGFVAEKGTVFQANIGPGCN